MEYFYIVVRAENVSKQDKYIILYNNIKSHNNHFNMFFNKMNNDVIMTIFSHIAKLYHNCHISQNNHNYRYIF